MMKWLLSPIATAKRKIALFIAKRALKRLRKATRDETLWLAGKLKEVANGLEALAHGDVTSGQVLTRIRSVYDWSQEFLIRVKKR